MFKKIIKLCTMLCVSASLVACAKDDTFSQISSITSTAASFVADSHSNQSSTAYTDAKIESVQHILGQITELVGEETNDVANTEISAEQALEEVTLVRVVDGDTLVVLGSDSLEYKVRLIGIDTPESVHSDASRNNEFGTAASDHTKEILADVTTLYLEYDKQVTDKYNRVLAYVWLSPDQSNIQNMLNAKILIDGFAVDKVYEPNHAYADIFAQLCETANNSNTGLWMTEGYHNLVNR